MQVRLDGQVVSTHRLHQSLPQTALVLQDVLEMSAEHLQHLEPASCTKHTQVVSTDQSHDRKTDRKATPTQVELVCDISALLLQCQKLHLQLQLEQIGSGHRYIYSGRWLKGSEGPPEHTSSSCFCIRIRSSASSSCGEKVGLSVVEAESSSSWRGTESGSEAS